MQSNHKNNNFIGHVTTLLSGAVGGQVVLLMVLPIVTRLYSPAVFGSVQSIDAIAQIVMVISALAYQRAFVVSDSEQDRNRLLILSLIIAASTALAGASITYLVLISSQQSAYVEALSNTVLAILLLFIFLGRNMYFVLSAYLNSKSYFVEVAKSEFGRSCALASSRVVLGVVEGGVLGLLLAAVLGSVFGLYTLIIKTIKLFNRGSTQAVDWAIGATMRKYKEYPLNEGGGMLFGVLADRLPVLILGYFFGAAAAGQYALALLVMNRPVGTIVTAATTVLRTYVGIAKSENGSDEIKLPMRKICMIALIVTLILAPLALFSTALFSFTFGAAWAVSGMLASKLAPRIFLVQIMQPIMGALSANRKVLAVLVIQFVLLIATLLPLVVGPTILNLDMIETVAFMGLSVFFVGLGAVCIVVFSYGRVEPARPN